MSVFTNQSIVRASFNGRNGAGNFTVTGLKVGDRMFWIQETGDTGTWTGNSGAFTATVASDDTLNQGSGTNLTSTSYEALFVRNTN